jgi:hypothetical protein
MNEHCSIVGLVYRWLVYIDSPTEQSSINDE